jgi:hypothetical protein
MRVETSNARLVIVALSGCGAERDRLRSKEAGCGSLLVKPIQPMFCETCCVALEVPPRSSYCVRASGRRCEEALPKLHWVPIF